MEAAVVKLENKKSFFKYHVIFIHFCQNIHNFTSCVKINTQKLSSERPLPLQQTNQTKLAPKVKQLYTHICGLVLSLTQLIEENMPK